MYEHIGANGGQLTDAQANVDIDVEGGGRIEVRRRSGKEAPTEMHHCVIHRESCWEFQASG